MTNSIAEINSETQPQTTDAVCPVGKWRGTPISQMPEPTLRWFAKNWQANPRYSDSVAFREAVDAWLISHPEPQKITREGMFRDEQGRVFRVQQAQAGHLYALMLEPASGQFVYIRGSMAGLSETSRLTLDECKAIGKAIGRCVVCGARLTDPASVERGIGPICANKI
jgi:hypothetical protein